MTSYLIHHLNRPWVLYEDGNAWAVRDYSGRNIHGSWPTFAKAEAWVRGHQMTMADPAPEEVSIFEDQLLRDLASGGIFAGNPTPRVMIFGRKVATKTPKRLLNKRMHDDRIGRIPAR